MDARSTAGETPLDETVPPAGDPSRPMSDVPAPPAGSDTHQGTDTHESVHQQLQVALETGGLGTWRWDITSGKVEWDDRLLELFGVGPGGFDGSYERWLDLIHPEDRPAVEAAVDEAVARGGGYRLEHRVLRPDGTTRWLVAAGTVTLDDDGELTGTIGCAMDVTGHAESRMAHERLAAEAMAAVEAERVLRERLEFLTAVNDALLPATDEADLLARAVWTFVPRLGDWCAIYLHDDEQPGFVSAFDIAHVDPVIATKARTMVLEEPPDPSAARGVALAIGAGTTDRWDADDGDALGGVLAGLVRAIPDLQLTSVLTLPLLKRGRILGALQIGRSDGRFDDEELSLAEAAAGRIAASVEVRRLSSRERRIARALQDSLLPVRLPVVNGLDLAVRYWPAGEGSEVGGDFYDVFHVGGGTWGAVIGDVCGTGPTAAALTGLARHSLRMSAWNGNDPGETICWLNRAVHEAETSSFLTAAYLTLTPGPAGVDVEAASGGHPHPLVVHADGTVGRIEAWGTLLGPFPDVNPTPVELQLHAGDTLILYTDGITDLPGAHGLDDDQLARLVAPAAQLPDAEAVADRIRSDIEDILPLSERSDDMALLVIRITGTAAS